jgi:diguanylate cyclase (GGDEF)-like protein
LQLRDLPETVAARLVDGLYRGPSAMIIGGISLTLCGVLAWLRTGNFWFLAWGVLSILLLACRLRLGRAYRGRDSADPPAGWAGRFLVGAWAGGVLWGIGGAAAMLQPDLYVGFLFITVQTGHVMRAAARNANVPLVAQGLAFLAQGPLLLITLAGPGWFMRAFAVFVALNLLGVVAISRSIRSQNVKLLIGDDEKSRLLAELTRSNVELETLNLQLESVAATDALTDIPNRRSFNRVLAREWRRAVREETPLGLLLVDIDYFKGFNDHYGHQGGDECLARVAAAISQAVRRPADFAARYGGEEFAVVLPVTDLAGAAAVADHVRCAVMALGQPHAGNPFGVVTVSVGFAAMNPAGPELPKTLLAAADAALYAAKRAGRNRIAAQPGSEGEPPDPLGDLLSGGWRSARADGAG